MTAYRDGLNMVEMPEIDPGKCNGCGLCVEVCSCGAVVMVGDHAAIIESNLCGWCALCEVVCPTGAIRCAYEIVIEEPTERT